MTWEHDRYCEELVEQAGLLRGAMAGADLSVKVPTCPAWTLGDLARHVGGAHRWAETIVRTQAPEEVPDDQVPDATGPSDAEPGALDTWLAEGASMLAETLRAAGPEAEVWTWAWDRHAGFWARRMVHETVIHRADAMLATRVPFTVDDEIAADTIEEWLQIVAFAAASGDPEAAELRGAGRSIRLCATDVRWAQWLIEFREDGFTWRRGAGDATVELRGPLADVLLAFYRRMPLDAGRVEVVGDAGLLDFWLKRASFG
ncbi:maleylpyruvate isomerase family mycothiol-dependent enzyme [Streptomyces sp. NPDC051320]|uniref:maleylpyruvate isomerase family mycothiol-dependent enzyme n=1 Tax=Streptomyces sp. NPDC051320 TaxID=3154644 RepID=UPI0034455C69